LTLAAAATVGFVVARWPDVDALVEATPSTTAFLERARDRAKADGTVAPRRQVVGWARTSDHLKHAVVVSEDIDFFSHSGFAWNEVEAAVRDTVEEGKALRGASTITQQLAKNLWLSPSRNPLRKLQEVVLTWQLERTLSKRRILELYLDSVEMGPGVWGAEAAARHFFGKPARDLSVREAAQLAAGLPRPTSWFPGCGSKAYARRVDRLVARMEKTAWVAREVRDAQPR
jgi:monofunctional biosynthetic peptidoglycan transglycosylase